MGGACELVAGSIRPDFTCDWFAVGEGMDMGGPLGMEMRFNVTKANDEMQCIFGWANVAVKADGTEIVDHQGDVIAPADLEVAAYEFVLNFREVDEMHTEEVQGHLVESFMATPDKLEAMGLKKNALPQGWWTGFYIPDKAMYEKARDNYPMFSIAGWAMREEVK